MTHPVLLLSPHNDDEALFASYVIMRIKPLVIVITDSFIQWRRGDAITAAQRRRESVAAMTMLGADVTFLGIPDDEITPRAVAEAIAPWANREALAFAPALQYGNRHHDMVSIVTDVLFTNVIHYSTYGGSGEWYAPAGVELVPTEKEYQTKLMALQCYVSQYHLPATRPHFEAVIQARSEWLDRPLPCD